MAKKIKSEDGKTYVQKKPFYKKWWVWLIVLLVIGAAASGGGGEDEATVEPVADVEAESSESASSVEVTEESSETEEVTEESGLLAIGESYTIDDVTVTVTDAYFAEERNEFAEEDPEQVLAIEYTLENNASEDYPIGMDFQVYVDGSLADTYPLENTMDSVSSGRSVEAIAHYGINGSEIEAEWEPLFSFSGDKGIWNVTPE